MPNPLSLGEGKTPLTSIGLELNPRPKPQYKMNPRALKRRKMLASRDSVTVQQVPTEAEAGLKQMIYQLGKRALEAGSMLFGTAARRGVGDTKDVVEMGEHAQEGFGSIREITRPHPPTEQAETETATGEEMGENFNQGVAALRAAMRKKGRR